MGLESIGTNVGYVANYLEGHWPEPVRLFALGVKWNSLFQGNVPSESPIVKRANKLLSLTAVGEATMVASKIARKALHWNTDPEKATGKKVEDLLFDLSWFAEALPRALKTGAYLLGTESLGGRKVSIAGDVGGLVFGALFLKTGVKALLDLDSAVDNAINDKRTSIKGKYGKDSDIISNTEYRLGFVTAKKVSSVASVLIGAALVFVEAIALAKAFKLIDPKKVPAALSLSATTIITLGLNLQFFNKQFQV